jgi:hypothetical protein
MSVGQQPPGVRDDTAIVAAGTRVHHVSQACAIPIDTVEDADRWVTSPKKPFSDRAPRPKSEGTTDSVSS